MSDRLDDLVLRLRIDAPEQLLHREWLVANGLGGYASGTIGGAATRRYHGLLVAALPAPLGRRMMFNHLSELVRMPDGTTRRFGGEERVDKARAAAPRDPGPLSIPSERVELHGAEYLEEFRLEAGLPVWRYAMGPVRFERRILLPHQQNSVLIQYRLLDGPDPIRLKLRPSVHFRPHDAPVNELHRAPYSFTAVDRRYELRAASAGPATQAEMPPLRLYLCGASSAFTVESRTVEDVFFRIEESRGYESSGDLYSPGYFRADLDRDHPVTLIASAEQWDTILALSPDDVARAERERRRRLVAAAAPELSSPFGAHLVLGADQFVITPVGRAQDAARAHAAGDEIRSVIAGYHWFTDWGRDTMISLEGLFLQTGRIAEAGYLLRMFAEHLRDGLIPNMFPEREREGLYHTADATLWFFHAVDRYLEASRDRETLRFLLPKLLDVIEHHVRGTRFGIRMDPRDGLITQGAAGYQLTWMDAKVGDWVVTPRRGKAVEINALWYNALRLVARWVSGEKDERAAGPFLELADRAYRSFNERFWYAEGGYLYDVVDGEEGDDPACRPNQVLAISLPHPVLDRDRWGPVVEVVRQRLLTPVGLRSLAPGHPDYKPYYYGDLRARDAAYHQGTVWAWLIGPYVDAWMRVHPEDRNGALSLLSDFQRHLGDACVGSISEVFDAEPPYTPRGCVAQAWSVAEVLRVYTKLLGEGSAPTR